MSLRGIDVSSWQASINWALVAGAGFDFAIVKASGGAHYRNPRYRDQIAGARSAGLLVGHYHYAHELSFNPPPRTPEEEARYFLDTIDARPGDVVALDIEDPAAHGDLSLWALAWLRHVEAALGCAPLVYTYPFYAIERHLTDPALGRFPLWWASYDTPPRRSPAPWTGWTILQHTATGTVPGIGPNIDLNRFEGDRADFRALGLPDPAQPARREDEAQVRCYLNDRKNLIVEINFGGEAQAIKGVNFADIGGTVVGMDDAEYDRTLRAGAFEPWVRRP